MTKNNMARQQQIWEPRFNCQYQSFITSVFVACFVLSFKTEQHISFSPSPSSSTASVCSGAKQSNISLNLWPAFVRLIIMPRKHHSSSTPLSWLSQQQWYRRTRGSAVSRIHSRWSLAWKMKRNKNFEARLLLRRDFFASLVLTYLIPFSLPWQRGWEEQGVHQNSPSVPRLGCLRQLLKLYQLLWIVSNYASLTTVNSLENNSLKGENL